MNKTIHTRRQFLRTSVLGGALAWSVPVFLERTFFTLDAMAADSMTPTGKDAPILVVLQLAGGNDGLNTLVPFRDDSYLRARPTLAIKNPLKITDELGLHPRLSGLRGLYDEGHLGIIQGVGYPNPNRSHFRSTEIWQTASDAEKSESHGPRASLSPNRSNSGLQVSATRIPKPPMSFSGLQMSRGWNPTMAAAWECCRARRAARGTPWIS